MSQSNVEVPPAAPAAQPAAVTPPAPAAVQPAVAQPSTVPASSAAVPAAPKLANDEANVDPNWFKPRLERERKSAFKAAGFDSEDEAKAAAKALKDQKEAEKATTQKLVEAQALMGQLKGRSDAITALLEEQATETFGALTEAQKAAVRIQAADDAPAEDRIKAIRQVKAMAAALGGATPTTQAAPATAQPAAAPAVAAPATPAAPLANTAPGRVAPASGDTSQPDHRSIYQTLSNKNPFAAAQYGLANPDAVYTPKA